VWDLRGRLEFPARLDLGEGATAREAMDDADQAAAGYAALADDEVIARNGIDGFAGVVLLKVVTVGKGKQCVMCRTGIAAGLAAAEASADGWLRCGSCGDPGSLMADGIAAAAWPA
jgi:hypothetical protein